MNKMLLLAIALGLWANAAATFIHPAHADSDDLALISGQLSGIKDELQKMNRKLATLDDIDQHIQEIPGR